MTTDRDDRRATGPGAGDTTDQVGPPSMGLAGKPLPARSFDTAELLHNPRARRGGRIDERAPRDIQTDPPHLPDTTLRERPPRVLPAGADDRTDETAAVGDPIAVGVTMPSLVGRRLPPPSHSAVTVPSYSARGLSGPSADEIAARVRDRPPAFPLPSSDHYECLRFLGEGGMGKVFLARDRRLGREVAIKFVRGDSRDHTLRLLAEARAQAQVNHDRVCKVYEVDEVDGQVYIAMQYIDGVPLGTLAAELTVEQKVMVMRDASEGVHAAHRVGIVHRDLNPNNIMVERDQDGRLLAYVMDFGLARDRKEGATETGTVMGTPHYMSPEQARGEVGRLDRRADIYSMGASLYVLLTGEQAIPGDNGLVVLNNIQLVEPRRLRALDPDIPIDLEAITLRCLEKDRSARYDSARALAEDLGRFLDGEPVLARRAGLGYRLRKRIRKHWRLLTATAIVAVLLAAAVGYGLRARAEGERARREAALRERLTRRFTERVEGIEASARYSALARLHDIRADRQELRARMDELAADVAQAGPVAHGPGHYALGRGFLALGDRDRARRELVQAWYAGYEDPRVAYALALVLGADYQEALVAADRISDDEQRAARKHVIEESFRDPAIGYLKRSQGGPTADYVAALIAFYEGRYDAALAGLDAIGNRTPWFYEGPELRGDILRAQAVEAARIGERERALSTFEAARTAYAAAAATGESVPELHAAQAALEQAALEVGLFDQAEVDAPFQRGVAATERALTVMPDHAGSLVLQATLYRRMAEFRGSRGVPVDDLLQKAVAAAQRSVEVAPASSLAWLELSRAYWAWGEDRQRHNQDPSDQLRRGIDATDRIAVADRDLAYYVSRGLIYKVWADYQDGVGADAQASRGKAIEAYEHALAVSPQSPYVLINLGATYFKRATAPRADDADGDLKAAGGALDRVLTINAKNVVAHFYRAGVFEEVALRAQARGRDPRPELTRALEHYRAGIDLNPALPFLYNGAGTILLDQALDTWDRGGEPGPLLDEARATFERAIAAAPDQVYAYTNVGEVLRRRAELLRDSGGDPVATARAAAHAFEQALTHSDDDSQALVDLGHTRALLADDAFRHAGDPEPSLAAAEATFAKLLAQNPSDGDAHLGRAATLSVRAQLRARRGQGRDADFAAAAAELAKALELAPDDQDARVDAGRFDHAWASWLISAGHDPTVALAHGLGLADGLLAARPAWAAARALRGSLLLLQAQADPAARKTLASRAAADLTAALAGNANLEKVWRSQATRAQQLADAP